MGILCAVLSIVFCRLMHLAPVLYEKYLPDSVNRAIVGGAAIIALSLLVGTRDYNGSGGTVIAAALSGSAHP